MIIEIEHQMFRLEEYSDVGYETKGYDIGICEQMEAQMMGWA